MKSVPLKPAIPHTVLSGPGIVNGYRQSRVKCFDPANTRTIECRGKITLRPVLF